MAAMLVVKNNIEIVSIKWNFLRKEWKFHCSVPQHMFKPSNRKPISIFSFMNDSNERVEGSRLVHMNRKKEIKKIVLKGLNIASVKMGCFAYTTELT